MTRGSVEAATFRSAMRCFPTGVTVVTTILDGIPHGFTANAVTSVSADPPSLLVCVNRTAKSHQLISQARVFAVNVLGVTQAVIAEHFAKTGDDTQFSSIPWRSENGGAPLLTDVLATFDCELTEEHSVATHTIFVGTVAHAEHRDGEPLGYFGGGFHTFGVSTATEYRG